jgi:hypothetical protein
MEELVRELQPKGIQSVFVYTREAHPGSKQREHRTLEDKLQAAEAFRKRFAVARPILVDSMEGDAHRAYGSLPNMTFIVGGVPEPAKRSAGRLLFKSDWTDPPTLRVMCDYILLTRERRRAGERIVPFHAEFAGYRLNDRRFTEAIREFAGNDAYEQIVAALEAWRQLPGGRPDSTIPES